MVDELHVVTVLCKTYMEPRLGLEAIPAARLDTDLSGISRLR